MSNAASLLQQLGFSEYEAKAYITLLQQSPLNGYELAKVSGIPRANIYAVLQKLEERHAVIRVEVASGTRYVPVAPDKLTRDMSNHFETILTTTQRLLREVSKPVEEPYIWNVEEYNALIEKARNLINTAESQLLIALWQPEAVQLAETMATVRTERVKVLTLCLQGCMQDCGGCREKLFKYHLTEATPSRWLLVIRDGVEMLMGNISPERSSGFHTTQHGFIKLADEYVRHSIALASILTNAGNDVQSLISDETRQMLTDIGVEGEDWLGRLHEMLTNYEVPQT